MCFPNLALCQVPNLVLWQIWYFAKSKACQARCAHVKIQCFTVFFSLVLWQTWYFAKCQIWYFAKCQIVRSPISTRENSMFHRVFKPFLSAKSGTLQSAKSGTLPNLVLCQNQAVPSPMRTRENPMFYHVFQSFLSAKIWYFGKFGTLPNPRRAEPD